MNRILKTESGYQIMNQAGEIIGTAKDEDTAKLFQYAEQMKKLIELLAEMDENKPENLAIGGKILIAKHLNKIL